MCLTGHLVQQAADILLSETCVVLLFLLSVQGALQLKQDFDSIREMIQSDKYGLSAELHQRLLSLRYYNLCYIRVFS